MEERSLFLIWNWICFFDFVGILDVMDYVFEGWGLGREVCWEEICFLDRGIFFCLYELFFYV